MITKQHLKIFLSFLSLTALLLGSCSAEDKLGNETQSSQVSGGSTGIRTSLPIWTIYGVNIPEEYSGRYTVKGVGSLNWGAEAYSGYWKDIYWDVKTNSISFTGGNFFYIISATYTSGKFHDINYKDGLVVTTYFTNGGLMYYLFLNEGNNYTVRTTNTLGNAPYYLTYSSKDY